MLRTGDRIKFRRQGTQFQGSVKRTTEKTVEVVPLNMGSDVITVELAEIEKQFIVKEFKYKLDLEQGSITANIVDSVELAIPTGMTQWEDSIWMPSRMHNEFTGGDPRPYMDQLRMFVRERAAKRLAE